jgi:hypothetical protein
VEIRDLLRGIERNRRGPADPDFTVEVIESIEDLQCMEQRLLDQREKQLMVRLLTAIY